MWREWAGTKRRRFSWPNRRTHVKSEQDEIAARVGKLLPLKRSVMILAGVMTLAVVVYFVYDVFHQF